jgi:acetoin utilization deacetylase AcuC-like enzyme
MRTGLTTDARFRDHRAPGEHPECPERLDAIDAALAERKLDVRCERVPARMVTRAELERVHSAAYLDALFRELAGDGGWLDPDTYWSRGSLEAAQLAAGATVEIATRVAEGKLDNGIAFVRPPGHHALRDRAMGFCLLNNVAVAAGALRAKGMRIAIVDFDVHHGNGTEAIFWDDPDVMYVSTHQYPFYPGTGPATDRGGEKARGATVNVPLPPGSGDAAYIAAFGEIILPAIDKFRPDQVLLSAGFDAHRDDPLAEMNVSDRGFAYMTSDLLLVAQGKLAAVLEGGYHLTALGRSAAATVSVLLGDDPPTLAAPPISVSERAAITAAARAHAG